MKKLIIAALLIVGIAASAQEKRERPERANMEKMTPEQRNERRVERMTKELNLDATQQEKLKQLYADEAKNREAQMADRKNKKGPGREMMAERMKATEGKMKEILTTEQFQKWKSSQDKMRERMQQRMTERQGGVDMEN